MYKEIKELEVLKLDLRKSIQNVDTLLACLSIVKFCSNIVFEPNHDQYHAFVK